MRIGFAIALVMAAALSAAPAAHAAFPGENGKIAASGCGASDCGIFVMNPDGSGRTQLTHGEICPDPEGGTYSNGAYDPAWSPDGRRLAFTKLLPACGETPQVFLADADGTNATQLTHLAGGAEQAAWSPDGTELAFTGFTTHGPEVFAIGADGSNPRDLTSATTGGQNAGDPAWSPDGTKIAFRSNPYVYVMDADGSNPINVTSPTESTCYVNSDPNWSPDGQKLVLVRRELVACDQTGTRRGDIWVMNADGTNRVDVTNTPFPDDEQTPAWSPDGAKIVAFNPYPAADLFVMSSDGSNRTTIGGDNYPDWQPIPQSYARPKGATPFTTYLVPAFKQCASPNRTHGAPLAFPSCVPPVQSSDFLTVGTADSNGAPTKSMGSVRYDVFSCPACAGPGPNADVHIAVSIVDVRNKSDLSDYTGELQVDQGLRITDRNNTPNPGGPGPATVSDTNFPVTVPCSATGDATIGSSCAATTSTNALVPNAVVAGFRAIWQLGQVKVSDGGPDGVASTSTGNTLFMVEGVFVP